MKDDEDRMKKIYAELSLGLHLHDDPQARRLLEEYRKEAEKQKRSSQDPAPPERSTGPEAAQRD